MTTAWLSIEVKESRFLGDSTTRKPMLDTTGVELSTVPEFVTESACFDLSYFREGPTYGGLAVPLFYHTCSRLPGMRAEVYINNFSDRQIFVVELLDDQVGRLNSKPSSRNWARMRN
jgi:hypothetical protein